MPATVSSWSEHRWSAERGGGGGGRSAHPREQHPRPPRQPTHLPREPGRPKRDKVGVFIRPHHQRLWWHLFDEAAGGGALADVKVQGVGGGEQGGNEQGHSAVRGGAPVQPRHFLSRARWMAGSTPSVCGVGGGCVCVCWPKCVCSAPRMELKRGAQFCFDLLNNKQKTTATGAGTRNVQVVDGC